MIQYRRKIKTDMDQLKMLYRLSRFYNSPKTIRSSSNNPHSYNRSTNNSRTIYLQKTNPISFFPLTIRLVKKDGYNYSNSPNSRYYYSPSHSGYNSISYAYYPINRFKKKYYFERTPPKNRIYNNIYTNNTYTNNDNSMYNRNFGQINRLKNSLGNPNQARNVMINNNARNNRFISISPSKNSNNDSGRDKNNDNYRYNEIEVDKNNNFDNKHKIRYLLSKNHAAKLGIFNKKKTKSKSPLVPDINNIKNYNNFILNNNTKYNNRSFSYRFYPNNDNYISKYNMENSPGIKSNNTDGNQNQTGALKIINNNIQRKKVFPNNISSILNKKTPQILSRDKIIREEIVRLLKR